MIESYEEGGKRITLIDLSDTLENETSAFEPLPHHIEYINHLQSLKMAQKLLNLDDQALANLFPEGHAWAVENVTLSTHAGTHVDAPYHYGPTSEGKPARTIEQLPLRWFYSDGVVLNMSHKKPGEGITAADIEKELQRIKYELKPYDIVLIRTDAYKHFKEAGYDRLHAGLTREAVKYLVEKGVKVIGIDAWGLDRPFNVMIQEAQQGIKGRFWEAHFFGKEREYCQIEKMANLDKLPRPYGFKVVVFPFKLKGASASWTRAVAIFEEGG
jgi:kynurenine formamidase